MTALLLSAAGSALGGALGPVGAIVGRIAGAAIGSVVDQRLFGQTSARSSEGPRLPDLDVQASTEGQPVPQLYGRARVTGQIIWATRFEEVATTETQRSGKGAGGARRPTTTTYSYFANFAVGLCEGPVAHLGRVWADGAPLDLGTCTWRFHGGTEDQAPDPLIQAKQGTPDVPAYRGLAYVVFERLPLAPYGNRLPQLSFELVRPIGRLEPKVRGVCLIPGATEFGYGTTPVSRETGLGASRSENRHGGLPGTDLTASVGELARLCPRLGRVALVAGWFGDDLRAGRCRIRPGVDRAAKNSWPAVWRAGGVERDGAHAVSLVDGRAAYGGTPSDESLREAIAQLKGRGLAVTLAPFLFLDIPPGNALPDPATGAAAQPAMPWRGRITCDPAPGRPGSPDGSAAVLAEIAAFFGTAAPADFTVEDGTVLYAGPDEWSYRRFVLHNAHVAAAAGGVDSFLIGSELVALTRLRSARRSFPAVDALAALAADVKAVLGAGTTVTYGADWTEYGGYVPAGTGDLLFPLDRLWASAAVDRVGIDWYAPMADWRDGDGHADAAEARRITDRAYLAGQVAGGEAFDWYYADPAARAAQVRSPITDGAYGKPWVHRPKDLAGWWLGQHVERLDGVEVGATGWQPGMKPIRFTELGVPAVDKGPNQPNLFPDAHSSEGGYPVGSRRHRDDAVQRRALEVLLDHFDPALPGGAARNPVSPGDGRHMVEHEATHLWCWDARPWPFFPALAEIWGDADNWRTGHWLNGRLGAAPAGELIAALSERFGGPPVAADAVAAVAAGYVVDRPMSGRSAIEPLAVAFGIDLVERAGTLLARPRGERAALTIDAAGLVAAEGDGRPVLVRADESELPRQVSFTVTDAEQEFRRTAVTARRASGRTERESRSALAVVMPAADAEAAAELALRRVWAARETASFAVPPSLLALEPGDVVDIMDRGRRHTVRLVRTSLGAACSAEAEGDDPGLPPPLPPAPSAPFVNRLPERSRPQLVVLDLPALPGAADAHRPRLAAFADPWPGELVLWRARAGGFEPVAAIAKRATLGRLAQPLPPGPVWRFDRMAAVEAEVVGGALASVTEEAVLDGANAFAVRHASGSWEVLQASGAALVAPGRSRLAGLLRGQGGTEALAAEPVPAGAPLVLLDDALLPAPVGLDEIGRPSDWRIAAPDVAPDDAAAVPFALLPGGVGLRPLAPVHARARRTAEGVEIGFIRRTRVGGDGWEFADVPLAEDGESYLVEVLAGAAVRRTLAVAAPQALYAAADEAADFGAPQASLSLRIRQVSRVLGPGEPLHATITT